MIIFTILNYKELTAAMRVSPIGFILAAAAVMSDAQNTVKKRFTKSCHRQKGTHTTELEKAHGHPFYTFITRLGLATKESCIFSKNNQNNLSIICLKFNLKY